MVVNRIIEEIKKAGTIAILPHVAADGDSVGSAAAFHLALKKLGISSRILLEEKIAVNYEFITGTKAAEIYTKKPERFDLVIALDCGDKERLGSRYELFKNAGVTVNIDHHTTNTEFAFINYNVTSASSTGEIVYQIIKLMGAEFDHDIAQALYMAIASDTGGFRFSNTTPTTHIIASELLNYDIDVADISQRIFDITTLAKAKLMAIAINSTEILLDGKVAFMTLTEEDFKSTGALDEDTDGIVNVGRNIKGVEVAVLFKKLHDTETKINLRSKTYVDVAKIAGLYKGGGHKRASGATVEKPMAELKEMILKDLKEAL